MTETDFLTLETGIFTKYDVRRNDVPHWRVRQAHPIRLWRHRINAKQSWVHFIHILHILDQNEENNHHIEEGTSESHPMVHVHVILSLKIFIVNTSLRCKFNSLQSHPRVQDLKHPPLGKPRHGLQILDSRMGFPRPSLNVVIDLISINLSWGWTLDWDKLVEVKQLVKPYISHTPVLQINIKVMHRKCVPDGVPDRKI